MKTVREKIVDAIDNVREVVKEYNLQGEPIDPLTVLEYVDEAIAGVFVTKGGSVITEEDALAAEYEREKEENANMNAPIDPEEELERLFGSKNVV